ncbi:rhodanese-like domain-containing protein [Marinihelvus fidelis]|uniref:Rhodanese-like domain-containing protein n=1 Tax=Marinihelvus fidelis TaxID=2613842 RepID=A0A5N0T9X7_9GAMM|nr:rhodanese-like domain-containing protein [Marinihelvus fidelis]KAA9131853.1 rhodanese-like domain-containing protein [Marinihelvus fidelis]
MQQLMEFIGNHILLSGGFLAVLVLLVATEVMRRGQRFRTLGPAEAVAFMNRNNAAVLDVSSAADFNRGHILGARNVPVSALDNPDKQVAKLVSGPLLVVCKNGQAAPQAAQKLIKAGAEDVVVLRGGMAQWASDQFPVTRA